MLMITAARIAAPITARTIIIGSAAEDKYVRKQSVNEFNNFTRLHALTKRENFKRTKPLG